MPWKSYDEMLEFQQRAGEEFGEDIGRMHPTERPPTKPSPEAEAAALEPYKKLSVNIHVGKRLKEALKRVYRVAAQPMTGEPIQPIPREESPIEYYASLAARIVALPLVAAREAIDIGTAVRKGAGTLRGGPRGELGEWTPEQLEMAANATLLATAGMGAGMPGGGVGPASMGRKEALKMLAKGFRKETREAAGEIGAFTRMFSGLPKEHAKAAVKELVETTTKRGAERARTYRGIVKGLKQIPREKLDPLKALELAPKLRRQAVGTFVPKEMKVRLRSKMKRMAPEEVIGHEVIHMEQFLKHPELIKKGARELLETHALEAGRLFAETVKGLKPGERITTEAFEEIYKQAMLPMAKRPYKRKEAITKITELLRR